MFLKKEINKFNKFLFICGLVLGFSLYSLVNAQVADILTIKYLDNFPGDIGFDSKYQEISKYSVYKYVSVSFKNAVSVNSVSLSFIVDNNWYNENEIEDVVFLKFDNGSWSRVDYNSKSVDGGYKKYQVTTNSVGQYWAIVGVLPGKKAFSNTMEKNNIQYEKNVNSGEYVKFIENIGDIGNKMLVVLREPVMIKGASIVATMTATVSAIVLLAFLGGPVSLWIVLQQMGVACLGLFFSKKKHRSGVVYDANTGMPVTLVRVDLIDKKSDRIKATKFTDKKGEYYFLAPKGGYYLALQKKGYEIVESSKTYLLKALLHESDVELEVALDEAGIIKKNIAILQTEHTSQGKAKVFLIIAMKYLANVAFFGGVGVSLWGCYVNPTLFNFFVLGIYLLIVVFKSFFAKNSKYGTIVNTNNRLEPFASINVLDAKTKKIISRVISDTSGRYYILLEKGEYILNVKTVKGVSVNRRINVKNKNILSQKLVIQK